MKFFKNIKQENAYLVILTVFCHSEKNKKRNWRTENKWYT